MLQPADEYIFDREDDLRRIGSAARGAFQRLFENWSSDEEAHSKEGLSPAVSVACEAQIASATIGFKPLYFDMWGPGHSDALREQLSPLIADEGARVHSEQESLFVFREASTEQAIRADNSLQRLGLGVLETILNVSPDRNGILLGYGQASIDASCPRVVIFDSQFPTRIYATFWASPDPAAAEVAAARRTVEIALYCGREVNYRLEPGMALA